MAKNFFADISMLPGPFFFVGQPDECSALGDIVAPLYPGCETYACHAPAELLQRLSTRPASLVVLPVRMHDDSAKTVAAIRKIVLHRSTPILMMAAAEQEDQLLSSLEAGANDFIGAPLDPLEFVTRAYNLVQHACAEREVAAARQEARLLRLAMQQSPAPIAIFDAERRTIEASESYLRSLALTRQDVIGRKPEAFLRSDDPAARQTFERELLMTGIASEPRREDIRDSEGRARAHIVARAALRGEDGAIIGLMSCALPFAETNESDGGKDKLTGLDLRAGFAQTLEAALANQSVHRAFGVLGVRLENLSEINAQYGRAIGDRFILAFQNRIQHLCQRLAVKVIAMSRLTGDTFAILCPAAAPWEDINALAERLKEHLAKDIQVSGNSIQPDLSIATVMTATGAPVAAVLAAVESEGGSVFADLSQDCSQDPSQDRSQDAAAEAAPALLLNLWDRKKLIMHYQPQFSLAEARIVSVDALLRWKRDNEDVIPPSQIFQMASAKGELGALTRDICTLVLEDIADFNAIGLSLSVVLKASPEQFADTQARKALQELSVHAAALSIDLETCAPPAGSHALWSEVLKPFPRRVLDCQNTPDFAGKAASPLFTDIKLAMDQAETATQLKAIVADARNASLRVIGGFVESADQLVALREAGADFAQGYFLQRPLDKTELATLVRSEMA